MLLSTTLLKRIKQRNDENSADAHPPINCRRVQNNDLPTTAINGFDHRIVGKVMASSSGNDVNSAPFRQARGAKRNATEFMQ
jgi:hypothetical protein